MTLPDLVPPDQWQRLQDHFADVLGIGLRTCSADRRLLVNPSWPAGLDAQKLTAIFKLGEELDDLLPPNNPPTETTTMLRPMGIAFSVCPLRAAPDVIAAHLVVGPVILGRRDTADQLRQRALASGADPNVLWPLMLTVKLYSFGGMRSVLQLLEQVGTMILELSYQARSLRALLPEPHTLDRSTEAYYTDRVAQALLEAAMAATGADGGSVMLYDRARDALQIRAAQGLPPEVAQRTIVRIGEGLAGLALAQRQVFLLDEQATDERLKRLMTRPEVRSALVAPLLSAAGQEPVGVLNLRTTRPDHRFTADHVNVLQRLLQLAGLALGGLQLAFGAQPSTP